MRTVCTTILTMVLVSFGEVVTFDNNWAPHPLYTVVSQNPRGAEIVFSVHELVVDEIEINGTVMKTYGIPGMFLPPDEGTPHVPGTGRYIAIPQGAQVQATVIDARTETFHNIDIAPAPNIPLESDDTPLRYKKNSLIYNRDAFYPESPVRISEPLKMRGVDIVILSITPFQYNPVTRELIVYKDLRVRLDFIGGNGHFGDDRLRSIFWEPLLQNHLLNYASLEPIDFYAQERTGTRAGCEYIIIVDNDPAFQAWADTIKRWRTRQGISCEVFTLADIGGSDTTAITNFLHNAYTTWDPAPVAFLLLGDYPSSGRASGIPSPYYEYYGYICVADNKYADMNGDGLPDMHHARICAQSDAQLAIMINKFLSYERAPYEAANYYNEPLLACGWQDDRWFQLCSEVVRGFFINALGKNPARQYNLGSPANPAPGCLWSTYSNTPAVVNYFSNLGYIPTRNPYNATWWNNGSANGINTAINSGAFVVQHRDHGYESGWGEPSYGNNNLSGLTNDMFTFVNSSNCLTGKYDWANECFAEKFHRIEHGASGLNAASEVSFSYVNDTYVWGSYDCLWQQFMPDYPAYDMAGSDDLRPCMAMTYGKYFLQSSSWPGGGGAKAATYMLFHHHGDAFMTLYSELPRHLSVSHPPLVTSGISSFTVTADDNSVIALTVHDTIVGVAQGTGYPVAIPITPQSLGDTVLVTITKANYYRYEAYVPVVASNIPYITRGGDNIDDTGGNGDGVVNPGEPILYGLYAKNIGTASAYQVYGVLSTSDTLISLTVDSSWYGDIAAGDSSLSNPYYSFNIDNDCKNGHEIELTITFHDQYDSIFTSYKSIVVHAPEIVLKKATVINDNNSNGILEPGETADIVVTVKNNGGQNAQGMSARLTTGSPYVTILEDSSDYGTVAIGDTANNSSNPFAVEVEPSTPPETAVDFIMEITSGVYHDTINFTLTVTDVGIAEDTRAFGVPGVTMLTQVHPNPFTHTTGIAYQISEPSSIRLLVYDVSGRLVRTLAHGPFSTGYYSMTWNAQDDLGRVVPLGVYFVRFTAQSANKSYQETEKVVLLR